jgi:ketosteroid isomerase-like protein
MRYIFAACAVVAGCTTLNPSNDDAARSLAQAERAFAAESVRTDMRAAFLANFADDGVLVSGGWTNARRALEPQPAPPIVLDWGPTHVEVAASGDLGLSTGPWIRKSRAQPDAPPAHGHFVSVWRRVGDGPWKVEVDLGIGHPQASARGGLEIIAPSAATGDAKVEQAEARFVEASMRSGERAAYEAHALDRMLFYRQGHEPVRGKAAALAAPAMGDERLVWLADALSTSRAGDFAYVRGTYADASDPTRVRGYFLRVWRREASGWGIALDVTNPAR